MRKKHIKKIILDELKNLKFISEVLLSNKENIYLFNINLNHEFKGKAIIESYKIEMRVDKNFKYFPSFYELEKKIPLDYHHHDNTSLCLATNGEKSKFFSKNKSIKDILEQFLIPYLYNFTHLKLYGFLAWEGYSHGVKGILEYYQERLFLTEKEKIIKSLKLVIQNKIFFPCPCGTPLSFKKCHYNFINDIPKNSLISDLKKLDSKFEIKTKNIKDRRK